MSKSWMRLSDEILHCKRVRKRVESGQAAFGRLIAGLGRSFSNWNARLAAIQWFRAKRAQPVRRV
jgi:hypothetical protein